MRIFFFCTLVAWAGLLPAIAAPPEPQKPPEPQRHDEKDRLANELAALKQDFEGLRAAYEARFAQIEARIAALEGRAAPAPAAEEFLAEAAAALAPATPPVVQPAAGGGGLQSLNPQVSLIGDFLASGQRNVADFEGASLDLREVEIAFQSAIDPFGRADVFLAVPSLESLEVEEGYLTFLTLPWNLQARLGKLRVPFGRANTDHRPESFAAERPDVINAYFGEEGLSEMGGSISRLLPNPWDLFMEIELDILDGANETSFGGGSARDLLYNVHYRTFFELNPQQSLNLGLSYATGVNTAFEPEAGRGRTHLEALDLAYRWKPLALGKYRSFLWQTELMLGQRDEPLGRVSSWGLYSFASYQLSRRWHLGGRFDYSQSPVSPEVSARSVSALVDFYPSEFQRFRLQYKATDPSEGLRQQRFFFQWYFLIGTHGAHKF
jgi:hypothetical protein